jgi:RNA polymerase sigma factor (sigma-70 family)
MALARGWAGRATGARRVHRRWGSWLRATLLLAAEGRDAAGEAQRAAARAGGAEFEAFFRQHERAIFTYLWRMTGDEQAAYDLSQETFVRAWRHFERVRGYELPIGWLFRVATNLALNHRARAVPHQPLGNVDDEEHFAQSDPALRLGEDEAVRRTLMALTPRQRAALVLRAVHGMSCAEVAAALGVSRDAAKMLLLRGRDEFRLRYEREGGQR